MIHKNMQKRYMILMIGIMFIIMIFLFMILGDITAGAMVTGSMILIMVAIMGIYFLVMFVLMKPKKGHHHHATNCVKCGWELSPGNLICPSCGHENKMEDLHGKHMNSPKKR